MHSEYEWLCYTGPGNQPSATDDISLVVHCVPVVTD